jgi:hypothetical protein
VGGDRFDDRLDPLAPRRDGPHDRRAPRTIRREVEHRGDLRRGAVRALAVRLVDHEDVGDLENPRLDRLDVVAQTGTSTTAIVSAAFTMSTSSWPTPTVSTRTRS